MEFQQVHSLLNSVTGEIVGNTDIITEDLSNVVDIGNAIFDAASVDKYVKTLVNKVGKVLFVNKKYQGSVPSVLMDSWEFGSIMQKISADMPDAEENKTWELTDGQSYDQDVFHKPTVENKFYNSAVTFEIPLSFTEKQVKQSFNSLTELNAFFSMITTAVDNSMTVKTDSLIMRTINSMISETVLADYGNSSPDYTAKSGIKAINLLKLYNDESGKSLKANACLSDIDFLRFATYHIGLYEDRLSKMSKLFNIGGKERFTTQSDLTTVLLSNFQKASLTYLSSETYNNELVALPKADVIPFWQGSGQSYAFEDVTKISVRRKTKTVTISGILGVMFDRNSLGVCNTDKRVTTNYNAKAEFYNNYYKFDASYFNDQNENFIVFFVA